MKNFVEIVQSLATLPHKKISREEILGAVIHFYKGEYTEIEKKHRQGVSGKTILKQLSEVIDFIVEGLLHYAIYEAELSRKVMEKISLNALGGLGRKEISPYSDIDLCILYEEGMDIYSLETVAQIYTAILWDIGLQIGMGLYTIPEAIRVIKDDPKTLTSYLNIRYLAGNLQLTQKCKTFVRYLPDSVKQQTVDLIKYRLSSAFQQTSSGDLFSHEPNIKEGAGGLRDYHATLWLVQLEHDDVVSIEDLKKKGYIDDTEFLSLVKSLDFLWKIRNEMHFTNRKQWDTLTIEMQYHIAQRFGYGDPNNGAIERLMKDYYWSANNIRAIFEQTDRKVDQTHNMVSTDLVTSRVESGPYVSYKGYLTINVQDKNWFFENPSRLMEVFWEVSRRKLPLSFNAQHWVQNHLDLIDETFRTNEIVNKFFLSICSRYNTAGFTFREMEKIGFLSRFIPEFGAVQGIIRYKDFHSYPVNEHTIRAVESLESLHRISGNVGDTLRRTLREIARPEILVLSILLHDLGKIKGEQHIEAGVQIARAICDRIGLSEEDTEHIAFLVQNHQVMVDIALNRDIDDVEIIEGFAALVQSTEKLKDLLLISYADLSAVGPNVWNDWKGLLLIKLFMKTLHRLNADIMTDLSYEEAVVKKIEELRNISSHVNKDELENHFQSMGPGYLEIFSAEEIALHLDCISEAKETGLSVRCTVNDAIGMSNLVVSTRDKHGLFAQIAGCFASQLVDVYTASLYTRSDGWVVDCFLVRDAFQHRPLTEGQVIALEKTLKSVILEGKDVQPLVDKTKTKLFALKKTNVGQTHIRFDNESSDKYTIIDIETNDRTGLLYDIASALSIMGLDIFKAKINTGLYRVRDSFYVQFQNGKILHRILQTAIRAGLLESIDASTNL